MPGQSPKDTVNSLMEAMNRGDVDAAVALYEPGATLVVEPGTLATGAEALRKALEGFISLKPTLTTKKSTVIEVGDIALFCSAWSLSGTAPDGTPVSMGGHSSDVLRRQADGRWLIAVDNPWGTAILG